MAISDEAQKRIEETDREIEEKYLKPPKGFKTHKEFVKWALALLDGEEWAKKKADELSAKKPK